MLIFTCLKWDCLSVLGGPIFDAVNVHEIELSENAISDGALPLDGA